MKKLFILITMALCIFISTFAQKKGSCTGKKICRVCRDCSRCKYCGKKKGHNCGVCNPRMK